MGPEKYDETAAAMIAQLKYGAGTPFYRLEQLESQLGIPLPAATQWEIVEEEAQVISTPGGNFGTLRDSASHIWIGLGSSALRRFNTSARFSPAWRPPVK